jgi:hypothetical protein
MRRPWHRTPIIVSLILTPIALLLGIGSGGAGHGDYFWAKVLFPYTMLSAFLFGSIILPFILLAVAQFPLYGIGLGYTRGGGRFARLAIILLLVHAAAAAVVFLLADENFS